jgi:hypothetical protein
MIQEEFNKIVENLAKYNDDYKIVVEDVDLDSYDPKNQPKNIRAEIRDAIKPQLEIATSLILTIKNAFDDNLDQTKHMNDAIDQIQSWEQTIHGACEQIIKTIESKDGSIDRPESIVNNSSKCSPKAFNKYIKNYTSRDYGVLELAAAIIVFYNSLEG